MDRMLSAVARDVEQRSERPLIDSAIVEVEVGSITHRQQWVAVHAPRPRDTTAVSGDLRPCRVRWPRRHSFAAT